MAVDEDSGALTCLVCGQTHLMPRVGNRDEETAALKKCSMFLKAHGELCKTTKAVC